MHIQVDPRIFQEYPGVRIGIIAAYGIKNKDNAQAYEIFKNIQTKLSAYLDKEFLRNHPHLAQWREAYKKFGVSAKEYPSSIENLALRLMKNQELRLINTLVDLYNAVSLKYLLPIGAHDLDAIKGNIQLTYAADNEQPIQLLGEKEERAPQGGEIIYKDDEGALCRRWNWKGAERSKITPTTAHALVVIEALPSVSDEMLQHAVYELALLLQQYCGGTVTTDILSEQHPTVMLKDEGRYRVLHQIPAVSAREWDVYSVAQADHPDHAGGQTVSEHTLRVDKVAALRSHGVEPWPAGEPVNTTCAQVLEQYVPEQEQEYSVAGRVVALRSHGKTIFGHIQDRSGRLQFYIRLDSIGNERYQFFNTYIDVGDIIGLHGTSFTTKTGEVTLKVDSFTLLSKCLYPLPEKFHGLTDVELRYRQRYLDLISNPESREKFKKRSAILRLIRQYLDSHDFMEVETPMLHPIAGGAAARPFVTHHNAYNMDLYLRIAPELYLKRLVVGGFERVYEINRNFRNEGISTRHNPEFTMLEFYQAYMDYQQMMDFVEQLLRFVIQEACGMVELAFGDKQIDFGKPFTRIAMKDAVVKWGGLTTRDVHPEHIDATLRRLELPYSNTYGQKLVTLFEELVEPHLVAPTFIIDFPIEISPLAKRDPRNPEFAARFELYVAGMEIANGFNELNDPFDQAERFHDQLKQREQGDQEAHAFDADYIHALEHGLPPTAGCGIGIDRLVMLCTNTTSIKDVILFPTLKKKE